MTTDSDFPAFTEDDFYLWQNLIRTRIGHQIRRTRMDFLKRRLDERIKVLGLGAYDQYYHYLNQTSGSQDEWKRLIELLVNCQSSFFRHPPSFEALTNEVLKPLVSDIRASGQIRPICMWSVGCSMGQEPYSLAMTFEQIMEGQSDIPALIMGTDISLKALLRAKKGEYSVYEIGDIPGKMRETFMMKIQRKDFSSSFKQSFGFKDSMRDHILTKHMYRYRVKGNVRRHVRFALRNIIRDIHHPDAAAMPLQDVIFCQNVFIYFDIHHRARTIAMLLERLRPGGYLFLAPGEAVGIQVQGATNPRFKDTMAYKRNKEKVHVRVNQ